MSRQTCTRVGASAASSCTCSASIPGARSTISFVRSVGWISAIPWQLALRQHFAVFVDHHPGTVEFQAGFDQQGLVDGDAAARLDGVHGQR